MNDSVAIDQPDTKPDTKPGAKLDGHLDSKAVREYLQQHPQFFVDHTDLLEQLYLPHQRGQAVSLVERQMAVLRSRKLNLERQLQQLVDIARDNERIAYQMHHFAVEILHVQSEDDLLAMIRDQVLRQFQVDEFVLLRIVAQGAPVGIEGEVRQIPEDSPLLQAFSSILHGSKPRCGVVDTEQQQWIFTDPEVHQGSSALIPLVSGRALGVLCLGSQDPTQFAIDKGDVFLRQMGELVSAALNRFNASF